jgi:hypothetical protein
MQPIAYTGTAGLRSVTHDFAPVKNPRYKEQDDISLLQPAASGLHPQHTSDDERVAFRQRIG